MSELEQANVVLAEAREVLKKSEENLNKSLKANDLALVQHRELAYALSCLVHPFNAMKPLSDDEIEQLKQSLKNIPSLPLEFVPKEPVFSNGRMIGFVDSSHEHIEHREVYDIVNAINVLAMANTDILNIQTTFRGQSNLFVVRVRPLSSVSPDGDEYSLLPVTYREEVSLVDGFYEGDPTGDCPIQRLLRIESEVTEQIIEAREEAEAKAEVTA
ncbi:hypothetical protein AB4267_02235 [Vibrio cyclitrophicus]|uniref:Uncharacterized protein n=1 Tax=Vibrio pelagius TaxID=28169 RepID=A0ABY5G2X1_VIBPE|nr:hypothetical protein [Vibrio pelagius]UTT84290.1 hypothetical protein LZI70_11470 [Vibrio pelagius]